MRGPLLIVTGAHLRAEVEHRPIAYSLRESILTALRHANAAPPAGLDSQVIVCSDVWTINHADLQARPAIAVGAPEFNALSAAWAMKLPSTFVIDGRLMVQMSLDAGPPRAACWGVSAIETATAVRAFTDRALAEFLDAAQAWDAQTEPR